jgi:hypothetical protein
MNSTMLRPSLAVLALAAMLAGCADRQDKAVGDVAAIVNRHQIGARQVEQVLQQRNLRPEQAETAGRQVLERLIPNPAVTRARWPVERALARVWRVDAHSPGG